ncbi:replication protein A 32 kDa subunit [Stomoxys calcitrans]|uniref:Replication protein A C-terminal domain-containing protein n=1 Tax=Stomoxys calcitrans TaxID=35570 RepID=A0A1I8NMN2_STOCA|nr:replication protein A 32 kDa subunit [Stomoxys calcitrans]
MNDTFGGEFNANQTTDGAASEKKSEGIAPVLIKQVLNSPEGNFQMFEMSFSMVCVKAIVRNIDTSSTKITYTLEDSTGRIEAHYWLEEGDTLKAPDVMLNNYATVYGSVRSQGGQKTLMVFKMLPVNDANEVVTHILEVLNARYKSEEYATKGGGCDFSGGSKAASDGGGFGVQGSNDLGLDGKNLVVFKAIKEHMSNDGISRDELKRKFTQMRESELNGILDFMISEGHIYSSIDTDHFLSTE